DGDSAPPSLQEAPYPFHVSLAQSLPFRFRPSYSRSLEEPTYMLYTIKPQRITQLLTEKSRVLNPRENSTAGSRRQPWTNSRYVVEVNSDAKHVKPIYDKAVLRQLRRRIVTLQINPGRSMTGIAFCGYSPSAPCRLR